MITLFGGGPGFGLPEVSPYVTKTEVQLKMLGLPYRKERARPDQSPKGQVPFMDDDGTVVADSTFIRTYLEKKHGRDLDSFLDARQRAGAWAIERMLENHLGWVAVYARWVIPENFAKGPARWFDHAPDPEKVRAEILGRVHANLKSVGIGRHSPEEILELGDRSLTALSELLGAQAFLFGDQPCGADATAFGILSMILTPHFDSPLRQRAEGFVNLVSYVARSMHRYYPEHPWNGRNPVLQERGAAAA